MFNDATFAKVKSGKHFENCPKCAKKRLINVTRELDIRYILYDTGTKLKQSSNSRQF